MKLTRFPQAVPPFHAALLSLIQGTGQDVGSPLPMGLPDCRAVGSSGNIWSKEDRPFVEEDQVREHLNNHPRVLRDLSNVIVRPLLTMVKRSW